MTRLLLMGPPGAGKGTQAGIISDRLGIPAISTGDILRDNVAARTTLGLAAGRYMQAGDYVPDRITNELVRDRLAADDCRNGFLLDGYPRTTDQVRNLDDILAERGTKLDGVIVLRADSDELVRRLTQRAAQQGRIDDDEQVQRYRQQVYQTETSPLLKLYAGRGLLREIDGIGEIGEVTKRVLAALETVPS